jgi:hypothetical protein
MRVSIDSTAASYTTFLTFPWRARPENLGATEKSTSPKAAKSPHSLIPKTIDGFLQARRWQEKSFGIDIRIDQTTVLVPTNKIDNFKKIA